MIAERFSIILHLNDSHCKLNFIQRFSCFSQNSFVHYSQIFYRAVGSSKIPLYPPTPKCFHARPGGGGRGLNPPTQLDQ